MKSKKVKKRNEGEKDSGSAKNTSDKSFFFQYRYLLIVLFLTFATLAVYGQVKNHAFVDYDDDLYITENRQVQSGLSLQNLKWAFGTTAAANWHPLTWISHLLDVEFYGLDSGRHHLTNLIFHILNCLLLFFIFARMTKAIWPSAFVAALFALHPIHVESVAWIAERKDVLSTFFGLLTIICYARYAGRPGIGRYLPILLCFGLGLMAKPMLVTLPFVLLLLDYWPLGRLKFSPCHDPDSARPDIGIFFLVYEKIPLFALTAASSIVTFLVQQKGGAIKSLEVYPFGVRAANALHSYVIYIGKMFWPQRLAVLYPHAGTLPIWQVAGASFVLMVISLFVIRFKKTHPYLIVGWLWYLGTLIPVIGLVQVGAQAMADRYTYVPLIGLFIMIAWGTPDLLMKWRHKAGGLALIAAGTLAALMISTGLQVRYWKNSMALYHHTIAVTSDNAIPHNNIGHLLAGRGKLNQAIKYYRQALRINPGYAKAHNNLGDALGRLGRPDEAVKHHQEALRIKPGYAAAHNSLGIALAMQGRIDAAVRQYQEALRIKPDLAEAHNNLGLALAGRGQMDEAIKHFKEVLRLRPATALIHINLGDAQAGRGRLDAAMDHYLEALRLRPDFAEAHNNLGRVQIFKGNVERAIVHFKSALKIKPDYADAKRNLRRAQMIQRKRREK